MPVGQSTPVITKLSDGSRSRGWPTGGLAETQHSVQLKDAHAHADKPVKDAGEAQCSPPVARRTSAAMHGDKMYVQMACKERSTAAVGLEGHRENRESSSA